MGIPTSAKYSKNKLVFEAPVLHLGALNNGKDFLL